MNFLFSKGFCWFLLIFLASLWTHGFHIFKYIQSVLVIILFVHPNCPTLGQWRPLILAPVSFLFLDGFFSFWASHDITCLYCVFLAPNVDLAIAPRNPDSGQKLYTLMWHCHCLWAFQSTEFGNIYFLNIIIKEQNNALMLSFKFSIQRL